MSYVIRAADEREYDGTIATYDVEVKYIKAALVSGPAFEADSMQVHTYVASLIAGNTKAEAAIQKYHAKQCGRADWKALDAVYQGVGAYKIEIVNAEKVIKALFYSGEKKGHVNWQSFEQKLVKVFNDLVNNSGVRIYDEIAKIKLLLEKISSCVALNNISTSIKRDLAKPAAAFESTIKLRKLN